MIKIKLVNIQNINTHDYSTAWRMACAVDYLKPSEREAYAAVIYNAIQWAKNVR